MSRYYFGLTGHHQHVDSILGTGGIPELMSFLLKQFPTILTKMLLALCKRMDSDHTGQVLRKDLSQVFRSELGLSSPIVADLVQLNATMTPYVSIDAFVRYCRDNWRNVSGLGNLAISLRLRNPSLLHYVQTWASIPMGVPSLLHIAHEEGRNLASSGIAPQTDSHALPLAMLSTDTQRVIGNIMPARMIMVSIFQADGLMPPDSSFQILSRQAHVCVYDKGVSQFRGASATSFGVQDPLVKDRWSFPDHLPSLVQPTNRSWEVIVKADTDRNSDPNSSPNSSPSSSPSSNPTPKWS